MGDTAAVAAALRRDPGSAGGRSHDGWTPLHLAAFFGQHAAATALVDAGADLAAVSQNGLENQPLHAALAGAGDSAIVTMLVERGADVNATSHGGWRPLHLAASRGAAAFVELLLAHGADPSAFASGKLPADIAAERGHAELARALRAAPPRMG